MNKEKKSPLFNFTRLIVITIIVLLLILLIFPLLWSSLSTTSNVYKKALNESVF